jgi:hypothetical protein
MTGDGLDASIENMNEGMAWCVSIRRVKPHVEPPRRLTSSNNDLW